MTRIVKTFVYFYIYSNDEDDMVWYSPSSDDKKKQDQNLLNCIEEVKRILRRNPGADIEICGRSYDLCDGFEDGNEYDFRVAHANEIDKLESIVKKGMKK